MALAATIALAGTAYFALAIIALHLLRPDHDPLRNVTSEYAVGPYGYLMTSAFFSFSVASFALVVGLYQGLAPQARSRAGLSFLALWGVGLLIAMIFPIDADGAPRTTAGAIHTTNGPLAFLCMTAGVLLVSRRFKRDEAWRSLHPLARSLSLVILAGFIALPLMRAMPEFGLAGLAQRIVLAAFVTWAVLAALRLRSLVPEPGP